MSSSSSIGEWRPLPATDPLASSYQRAGLGDLVLRDSILCAQTGCTSTVVENSNAGAPTCEKGHDAWEQLMGYVPTPSYDDEPDEETDTQPEALRRFALERWADVKPPAKRRYVVKDVIPHRAKVQIFGESNSSKTFVAMHMCGHIAAGLDWMGHRVTAGAVVYVVAEGPEGFSYRAEAQRRSNPAFADMPLFVLRAKVSLLLEEDVSELIAAISETCPDAVLVVLDTWAEVLDGNDSDGPMAQLALNNCGRLMAAFPNLSTLSLHHPGHSNKDRARGASHTRGALDVELRVSREGENEFSIVGTKSRDAALMPEHRYRLRVHDLGTDQDGDPITSCTVEEIEGATGRHDVPKRRQFKRGTHTRTLWDLMARIGSVGLIDPPDEISQGLAAAKLPQLEPGQKVFRLDDLFVAFKGTIGHGQTGADIKPDSIRRTFNRCLISLESEGYVGTWEDFGWALI